MLFKSSLRLEAFISAMNDSKCLDYCLLTNKELLLMMVEEAAFSQQPAKIWSMPLINQNSVFWLVQSENTSRDQKMSKGPSKTKRPYFEKRVLPAYSTGFKGPETFGPKGEWAKKNIFSKLCWTVPYTCKGQKFGPTIFSESLQFKRFD